MVEADGAVNAKIARLGRTLLSLDDKPRFGFRAVVASARGLCKLSLLSLATASSFQRAAGGWWERTVSLVTC